MKNRRFGQSLQLFRADYHVSAFRSTFRQKLAKGASFREKALKTVDLAKTCNFFEQTTMFRRLVQVFGKKLHEVPHFPKKHEKSSIWPKLAAFMSEVPCFRVWVNFSAKSCKSCLVSRKSVNYRRFGQTLQLFRKNYHVSAFGSILPEKVAKGASFRRKASKMVDFAKT